MATYTEHYNLTMPEEDDYYHVENFNENFETIDTLMAENETVCNEINEKIGKADEDETIFSLLKNSSNSLIKSIQTVEVTHSTISSNKSTLDITAVDPVKCIVLMYRMGDSTGGKVFISYTLEETKLIVSNASSSDGSIKLQFQIIEFN